MSVAVTEGGDAGDSAGGIWPREVSTVNTLFRSAQLIGRTWQLRRGLWVAVALSGLAAFTPVRAQSLRDTGDGSPPHVQLVDDNGVNFWSSDISLPMQAVTIGPKDSVSSLDFGVTWSGSSFGHNFLCYAVSWRYVGYGGKRTGSTIGIEVICNNSTTQFLAPGVGAGGVDNSQGTGYLNAAPNGGGETLVQTTNADATLSYLYTDRNGVQTTFKLPASQIFTLPPGQNFGGAQWVYNGFIANDPIYLADTTSFPNGMILKYSYSTYSHPYVQSGGSFNTYYAVLQSVNSNTGSQIKFSYPSQMNIQNTLDSLVYYAGNFGSWIVPDGHTFVAVAINSSQEYCDAAAASCIFAKTWPSISISTSRNAAGSGATTVTAADPQNNVKTFQAALAPWSDAAWATTPQVLNSVTSNGGLDDIAIQRTFYNAPTSVTRGGVTTTYSWFNRPNSTLCNQWGCPVTQSSTQQVNVNKGGVSSRQYNTAGNVPSVSVGLGYMTSIVDGVGNTTSYSLGCEGIPANIQSAEGNKTVFTFDSRCNVLSKTEIAKPGSGLANIVTSAGYATSCAAPATCNKPTWAKDALGSRSDYTYTTWGALATELLPAPSPGLARPLKLYTYQQKAANVVTSTGALGSTGQLVWVPATEVQCQTAAGSADLVCDPGAPQVTTTYLYGATNAADNLWVRGKQVSGGSTTLVTCFTYDQWGRRVSETLPNANLTSCP